MSEPGVSGVPGGLSRGQSWFRAWEEETQQKALGVVEGAEVGSAMQEEAVEQPGSSQDHLALQGRQEETEQEARVKQAKEVQAGIMARLTRWLGGCQ